MSFVWICKCGLILQDKEYLSCKERKTTQCPNYFTYPNGTQCEHFLSCFKRIQQQ